MKKCITYTTAIVVLLAFAMPLTAADKYRILVSNDDGIHSAGIAALVTALSPLGDVTVVAPLVNRSGASHSIDAIGKRIRMEKVYRDDVFFGYAVQATPADAVGMGIRLLGREQPFDLVVSGINYGNNAGIGSHYSGTVGAAIEAAIHGVPAIAISQASARATDYALSARVAANLAAEVLQRGLSPGVVLNVNVPVEPVKGVEITSMGDTVFAVSGPERHIDRSGAPYYKLTLKQRSGLDETGTDGAAYLDGFITIMPLQIQWTDTATIEQLRSWQLSSRLLRSKPASR